MPDETNFTDKPANSIRANSRLTEFWLRTVRAYTFNTPIHRGRHRAYLAALKVCGELPGPTVVQAKDGRLLSVDLRTGMQTTVFFLGEYEPAITKIVTALLPRGGTFLDVGANFGWYTTLFAKFTGASGQVHAFEPVPAIFANLARNHELMGSPSNVRINQLALGDEHKNITINLFQGLSTGHASLSDHRRDDAIGFQVDMITLDSYLEANDVGDADLVKVDIEGAELMFLRGAEKLFAQKVPPVFLMEMALNQSKHFGHVPNDLLEFMRRRADYEFYKVDELAGRLTSIDGFEAADIGANVICVPVANDRAREAVLTFL